ncbi:hypothetical protein EBH_0080810 [Eimeria brunetti]|uniref:Uncharacterized protein n=1 Tax=Eimeria brunetti TaxID=51314 RepID=U6LJU3_9EIME|nr:hypothetical protein EBH_0080810 [Eimeria brunetti]
MTKLFRRLCDRAQGHILKAKWRQKYYADTRRRDVEYNVGDQAWLSSKHLPALNHCSKFEPKLPGPFSVTERIGTVAYRLALPPTYEGHNVFHVSQLVPHRPRAPALVPQEAPVGWPPTRDEAGNPTDQYLVDNILDQKGTGEEAYYLVKWRGVPEEQATWEPAHHLACKMAHFIPAKKSHSAADTVELLADRLIRYHGFPDVLASDRDPRFQSEVWTQLCSRFNITRAMLSSYHPQTDGQTERVNRTLEQMLRRYIQADEREWEGLLPALELEYNTTSHPSTELSPFEIMIGENRLTAADLDIFRGPFPVTERIDTVAYRLALPPTYEGHNVFHASQLVPHRPRAPALVPQEAPVGWPPTRDEAGNPTDQYLVNYILDQKGAGEAAYYLVKWRGIPEEKATWEPAHHLAGCPALLRAWRRRQNKRRPS